MHIGGLLSRHARYRPNHTAVIVGDVRLTYREFNARVNKVAHALQGLGLTKGDKIATILPNCLELLEVYWAAAKTGLVVVPMSTLLRGQGLASLLRDSDTAAVVTDTAHAAVLDTVRGELPIAPERFLITDASDYQGYREYRALVEPMPEHDPVEINLCADDPYNIMYSSGTTGLPKGIVLTHGVRASYGTIFAASYRIMPESVILHAGALVFNGAFLTFMPAFYLGTTYILMPAFNTRQVIEVAAREKVTHIKMVPSQIVALLNEPDFDEHHLPSIEMLGSVGAPLHMEHKLELERRFPNRLYELYGLTEGFMTILDKYHRGEKLASVGVPPPFMEIKIIDEQGRDLPPGEVGEICGRGPLMMTGYYNRPDLTAQAIVDGWLHSGDMGYVDEDGFLFLVDRKKDMIISGGINVFPRDIEEIIVQHPAVREAAVFGIPSEKWGETPLAAVILKAPGLVSPEELQEWINVRVEAGYQKVSKVVIMDDFPRSAAGKTLKRVMRDEYWKGRDIKM